MSERTWDEIDRESDNLIERALQEQRAQQPNCTCGAVDIPGGMHLDWCEAETEIATPPRHPR